MKILISLSNFDYLSGSPMYSYELSRQLVLMGHEVSILSKLGGILPERARLNGVKVYDFSNPPQKEFDVLHLNQFDPAKFCLDRYDAPAIMSIHSEWHYETPYRHKNIKKYIAIRPSIKEKLEKEYGIDNVVVIYNGIDFNRFNPSPLPEKEKILFVGTIDHLREKAAKDILTKGKDVLFVGDKFATWADSLPPHGGYLPSRFDTEELIKDCTATAGIMLGRTTIEGWACGRGGYIYDIDLEGNIKSVDFYNPPENMERFNIIKVAEQIEKEYALICGKH